MRHHDQAARSRSLLHREEGSVIVLVAVTIFMMVVVVGVAVDMARAQALQSKMASALDSAALAVGATFASVPGNSTEQAWVNAQAAKYFSANFPSNYLGSQTVITPVVNYSTANNITTINLTAGTTQNTAFLSVINIPTVAVSTASQVQRTISGLEIALVIDNTTSMAQAADSSASPVSKIVAAQGAACTLVGVLHNSNTLPPDPANPLKQCTLASASVSVPGLWMSLVPFTVAVNAGKTNGSGGSLISHPTWMAPLAIDYGRQNFANPLITTQTWSGCLMARPTSAMANPYASPNPDKYDESDAAPTASDPTHTLFTEFFNYTPLNAPPYDYNQYCPTAVTQMIGAAAGDEQTLLTNIGNMSIPPVGDDTEINMGAAWGLRLLSPNWTGLWGDEMDAANPQLPLPQNQPANTKVMILLTDGKDVFEGSSVPPPIGIQHYTPYNYIQTQPTAVINPLLAPLSLQGGLLGTTYPLQSMASAISQAQTALSTRANDSANTIKSYGGRVYTIGFGTGTGIDTNLLGAMAGTPTNSCTQTQFQANQCGQFCTSTNAPGFYCYIVPTNAALQSVFENIANQLEGLRVSK